VHGPGDQREVLAADAGGRAISTTRRLAGADCVGESLYGLQDRDDRSTPGAPSSSRRATCSRSPIAPITVTSSPRDGWARAPTDSIRSMTACDLVLGGRRLHHDHHLSAFPVG
jgi:hypothetical protein